MAIFFQKFSAPSKFLDTIPGLYITYQLLMVKMEGENETQKNYLINTTKRINGKNLEYLRPVQVRIIPLTFRSNRGVIPSLKLADAAIEYESQLERDFYYLLDHDPNCVDFQCQPWEFYYVDKEGKKRSVFPDCWAIFRDGTQFLFEIKTEHDLEVLSTEENWCRKIKTIESECKKFGWRYQIITERKIRCVRLDNIKDTLNAAKHFSPAVIDKDVSIFTSRLNQLLAETPKKINEIVEILVTMVPIDRAGLISLLKYKIYHLQVSIDWNVPLALTPLGQNEAILEPVYALPETADNLNEDLTTREMNMDQGLQVHDDADLMIFKERFGLIEPIIERYGRNATKSDIIKYCTNKGISFPRTYRWYRIFKSEGKEALYSQRKLHHEKTHVRDPRVEALLNETIREWNEGQWCQIKSGYEEFCMKCQKAGLKPAAYDTFRLRVKRLPAVERRGKFKPQTQTFIERGLKATYTEGRYPGCVIQMDHSPLDIRCVDSFTNQDYGRVHCTIGVDVFSRSIWTFLLSFESPNQETVSKSILKGLQPKELTKEWNAFQGTIIKEGLDPAQFRYSSHGFPSMIQVDNGRDFQAESVKQLCLDLNITLESRPVRTPEYGGFIESIWDTINDAIRNAKLPGLVYSKPKSREPCKRPKFQEPPGYDARTTASWTIEQFEEWLFAYIVTKYSADSRARQNHSPDDIWNDGLVGDHFQPTGGELRSIKPSEHEIINYMSKIDASCVVSSRGLRYKNILYTSDWFINARKHKVMRDDEKIEFKVSHDDIVHAWVLDPTTRRIETLEVYNYDGDDRIKDFLLKGVGKVKGYRKCAISLKMLEHARDIIGKSANKHKCTNSAIMDVVVQNLAESGKLNKKERRFIQGLAKSNEGKQKIKLAGTIAQLDDQGKAEFETETLNKKSPIGSLREESPRNNWFGGIDENQVKPLPNTWKEAKEHTFFSKYMEDDDE